MNDWHGWHKFYEKNKTNKKHVDNMYNLIYEYCKDNELKLAVDDRAEEFVAAITKYLEESK